MKRCIKFSTETGLGQIRNSFRSSNPGVGCTFIDRDGTYINMYPEIDVHEDLCEWADENTDIHPEYYDEEYFVREFGWVRLRIDPRNWIIELPPRSKKLTAAQKYALEDWLSFCLDKYPNSEELWANICPNNQEERHSSSDLINIMVDKDTDENDIMNIVMKLYR